MIKFEHTDVYGFEAAIRGMRNPKNSWDKSDSKCVPGTYSVSIGPDDRKLMRSLIAAGDDHGKFTRMIIVTTDIIAPLYWWKEFDTYKVGTVADSCSTMHKLADRDLLPEDFSTEHLYDECYGWMCDIIDLLNDYRRQFKNSGEKKDWWQMIQLLPSSFNQKRTVQLNYQVLRRIYRARKDHKLDEWRDFCNIWIPGLPFAEELITGV